MLNHSQASGQGRQSSHSGGQHYRTLHTHQISVFSEEEIKTAEMKWLKQ